MRKSKHSLEPVPNLTEDRQRARILNMTNSERVALAGTSTNQFEQSVLSRYKDNRIRMPLAGNEALNPTVILAMTKDRHMDEEVLKILGEHPNATAQAKIELHKTLAIQAKEEIDSMARGKKTDALMAVKKFLRTLEKS